MLFTPSVRLAGLAAVGLLAVTRLQGQTQGSLSDLNIEYSESRVTLDRLAAENDQLRGALSETQKTLADMRSHYSQAAAEREIFKRQVIEMKLKIEALGLGSVDSDSARVDQRLLTAVNDMRILAEQKKKLCEAAVRLTEASALFARSGVDANPESRVMLEAEIRNTNFVLGLGSSNAVEGGAVPSSISEGNVISVKDDLALVIMNLGSKHGVRAGMPFQVLRNGRRIGSVRAVDVRERIAGASIQNLGSEKERMKVGDLLKADAQQQ